MSSELILYLLIFERGCKPKYSFSHFFWSARVLENWNLINKLKIEKICFSFF